MKIGLLINSRLGLPSLQTLLENKIDFSILLIESDNEDIAAIQALCNTYKHPFQTIDKQKSKKQLSDWVNKEKPGLVMVMTFPIIIPKELLNKTGISWYNFHFALLPEYGGPEPIFWQIKNREAKGGITVHQMTEKVDSGPIVLKQPIDITEDETHGTHLTKLSQQCVPLMINLINLWQQSGGNIPLKSNEGTPSFIHPRADIDAITIKWDSMEAEEIKALVQACNPWNKGAISFLNHVPIRICEVELDEEDHAEILEKPGFIFSNNNRLIVKCLNKNSLILKILYINEGYFSGIKFNNLFNATGSYFRDK